MSEIVTKRPINKLTLKEQEYQMAYGALPNTREELLAITQERFPCSQKQMDEAIERFVHIQWSDVSFTLYLIPKPTPRPRTDGTHFYVKGAAENKRLIKKYIERFIIATRCEVFMNAYLPTPLSQMNHAEIQLAEAGHIRPIHTADVDNLMKTYLDMITGHLLLNDNLVTLGELEKFFSIKPRLEIQIRYQDAFDSKYNHKRMYRSHEFDAVKEEVESYINATSK